MPSYFREQVAEEPQEVGVNIPAWEPVEPSKQIKLIQEFYQKRQTDDMVEVQRSYINCYCDIS
jgi:hypothetical protein